jgi:hypothetical protein
MIRTSDMGADPLGNVETDCNGRPQERLAARRVPSQSVTPFSFWRPRRIEVDGPGAFEPCPSDVEAVQVPHGMLLDAEDQGVPPNSRLTSKVSGRPAASLWRRAPSCQCRSSCREPGLFKLPEPILHVAGRGVFDPPPPPPATHLGNTGLWGPSSCRPTFRPTRYRAIGTQHEGLLELVRRAQPRGGEGLQ